MSDIEKFETIFKKRVGTIKPGLSRMIHCANLLGITPGETSSILVGGTNGKGSVSGSLWLLLGLQLKVGLYTSPHLIHFRERFLFSHGEVHDADLLELLDQFQDELPDEIFDAVSFFELATLIAFRLFKKRSTEINIFEVGLGGRLDATNIADPLASIIVSIGLDHQSYLGDNLAAILGEKLGIVRRDKPLFTGDFANIIADEKACRLLAETIARERVHWWRLGREFQRNGIKLSLHLPGCRNLEVELPEIFANSPDYIRDNFSVAAAVYHWLSESCLYQLPKIEEAFLRMDQCSLPIVPSLVGRFLRVDVDQVGPFLFDVCHNVEGVARFVQDLLELQKKLGVTKTPGIVSILRDKDYNEMLDILKTVLDPIFLFKIDHERGLQEGSLSERHRDLVLSETFDDALLQLTFSRGGSLSQNLPTVVCGSVLAVGQVLEHFSIDPLRLNMRQVLQGGWKF